MIQNTSAVFNFKLETDGIGSLSYKRNSVHVLKEYMYT